MFACEPKSRGVRRARFDCTRRRIGDSGSMATLYEITPVAMSGTGGDRDVLCPLGVTQGAAGGCRGLQGISVERVTLKYVVLVDLRSDGKE